MKIYKLNNNVHIIFTSMTISNLCPERNKFNSGFV